MRIALLLFGQPRFADHSLVYETVQREVFSKYHVDSFCHAWWDSNNLVFSTSSWSTMEKNNAYHPRTIEYIQNLYNPIILMKEPQKNFTDLAEDLTYGRNIQTKQNALNVFSQLYSLQSVARACYDYSVSNSVNYKFYILARYDTMIVNLPNLKLCSSKNTYICGTHANFPDLIQIAGSQNFQWVLNVFENAGNAFSELTNPTPELIRFYSYAKYNSDKSALKHTAMHAECIRSYSDRFNLSRLRLLGFRKLFNTHKQGLARWI